MQVPLVALAAGQYDAGGDPMKPIWQLRIKIERARRRMYQAQGDDRLKRSQELDKLIVEYTVATGEVCKRAG